MSPAPDSRRDYDHRLAKALANPFLGHTLKSFCDLFNANREKAFSGLDFTAMAEKVAQAKDAAIPRLLELYHQFKENAEQAGAQVHLAFDAQAANQIIAQIAQKAVAGKIVKSKSMTAEETGLNAHLESLGLKVTETDLGEWIIQLRGEGPSHMVAPAVHLSRHQVAELFLKHTGENIDPDDIPALVNLARRHLRRAYLEADMGISGANFAVADSGTLGIVTNEGNARLCTTLPKVHVALVGMDKLLPDLGSALKILEVLPKNAAGQAISSYVTWIRGSVECAAAPDGRKEMHVVFLDNGRLALSRDPVFSEALRCVRCGACANVCPIWAQVGGHDYGHVYVGAIGLILTYFYHGREKAQEIVRNCLNCQACKKACAAQIDLPRLIKKTQALVQEETGRPAKNQLMARVLPNRRLFHFLLRRARAAQLPLAAKNGMIRHLPLFFTKEHAFKSLPVIVAEPLRDRWPRLVGPVRAPRLKVGLFGGCLIDFVYPEQAEALFKLSEGKGIEYGYPWEQTCCGLPAAMAAEEELAKRVARQNIEAFEGQGYDYLLTLCASCGSHLRENYPKLLVKDPEFAERAQALADKVIDFSSFARQELNIEPPAGEPQGPKAAYHAPCHLCRGLGVHDAPRELLRAAGYEYAPHASEEVCCGFGGSYSLEFPRLSARILDNKLKEVEASGAQVLLTDCPGCVLQLAGGLDARDSKIKVMHVAQALAKGGKS